MSAFVILQERVTLDEAVLASVETYRNGCNYALYFDKNKTEIGYGCDGVLINLQTGHKRLLHDWFASQHDHGDKTPLHCRVPLPVSPDTILVLKKRRPCDLCGAPYFWNKGATP